MKSLLIGLSLLFAVNSMAENQAKINQLVQAAGAGDLSAVRKTLANGADINAKVDPYGETALFSATALGKTEVVKFLLEKGAVVDAKNNSDRRTALMQAAIWGRIQIINLLLSKGANINATNSEGKTVLMWAAGRLPPEDVEMV